MQLRPFGGDKSRHKCYVTLATGWSKCWRWSGSLFPSCFGCDWLIYALGRTSTLAFLFLSYSLSECHSCYSYIVVVARVPEEWSSKILEPDSNEMLIILVSNGVVEPEESSSEKNCCRDPKTTDPKTMTACAIKRQGLEAWRPPLVHPWAKDRGAVDSRRGKLQLILALNVCVVARSETCNFVASKRTFSLVPLYSPWERDDNQLHAIQHSRDVNSRRFVFA